MTAKWLILVNLAATLIMVGVIWVMQIVHYPLFANVDAQAFPAYQLAHMTRITMLVLPLMLVEAITALGLALAPPTGVSSIALWVALALVIIIWGSTFLFQDAHHVALLRGFNAEVHESLIHTNWIRTIAWSIRAALMLGIVGTLMQPSVA